MSNEAVAEKVNGQNDDSDSATAGTQEESLDSILSQWDAEEETASKQPSKSDEDQQDVNKRVLDRLESWEKERNAQQFQETMTDAVKTVREVLEDEGVSVSLSDRMIRGILHDAADEDKRFLRAFAERRQNPKGFTKALRALAREEAKGLKVSKSETEKRDNVSSAMRAGRKQPPVNDADADADYRRKVRDMTPAEREAEKRRILRG